jgi:Domain of unknown function (DUF4440)
MATQLSRLPGFIIIVGSELPVNWQVWKLASPRQAGAGYNHAMRSRITAQPLQLCLGLMLIFALMFALLFTSACTFYGDHPARSLSDATGGEGLERVFWQDVQAANWVAIERALASNYSGVTPAGTLDRDATLQQYRGWQLKNFSLGDLKTELNGNTIVVTYSITLNGVSSSRTGGSQPLPSAPQHMMTVWQQQKSGWIVIAHSVSQSGVSQ